MQAYTGREEWLARKVCADDDAIDDLYNQIYRELLTYMLSDPRTIERATYLLWVAHNLERIADPGHQHRRARIVAGDRQNRGQSARKSLPPLDAKMRSDQR